MGTTNKPPLDKYWVESFGNSIAPDHKGKWNSAGTEYAIKSPYRSDDKTPSFYINCQKRIGLDRGTGTTYKISKMCEDFHIDEPDCTPADAGANTRKEKEVATNGGRPANPSTLAADEAQKAAEKQRFIDEARAVLNRSLPAPDNFPYLVKKHVQPLNAKYDGKDLIIPACNADGSVAGYEYIKPDGSKGQAKGTSKAGSFGLVAGQIQPLHDVIVAEGFATAASLHEITGLCTVESFGSANLAAVVEIVKRKGARAILCPDYDSYDSAKSAGADVLVKLPELTAGLTWPNDCKDGKWDWNDYHRAAGVDAAKAAWAVSLAGGVSASRSFCFQPQELKQEDKKLIAGLFPVNMCTLLTATPKTGKSLFMLYEAAQVSMTDKVLYLNGELGQVFMDDRQARAQWECNSSNFHIISANSNLMLDSDNGLQVLEDEIRKVQPCLVVIDSLVAWMGTDESDSENTGNMVNRLNRIAQLYKIAIVLIHHFRKRKAAEANLPFTMDDIIGSSKFARLCGMIYGANKAPGGVRVLRNLGGWIDIGRDEDGLVLTWQKVNTGDRFDIVVNDSPELDPSMLNGVTMHEEKKTKVEMYADKVLEDFPQGCEKFSSNDLCKRYRKDRHFISGVLQLLKNDGTISELEEKGPDKKTKYYIRI